MRTLIPIVLSIVCTGCAEADLDQLFTSIDLSISVGPQDCTDALIEVADSAETTLNVALPGCQDTSISDALIDAYDRGVLVEVVTDFDRQDDAGVVAMIGAGVPVTLADDGIGYFEFSLTEDVEWASKDTILSSSFAVADDVDFTVSSDLGLTHGGSRIVARGHGQDFALDLTMEHNQLFGGSDATASTAYSNPAKSIVDDRWIYPLAGEGETSELWFGPQQRVTKRIIDAVYAAKGSIWVLTDDFANEGLAKALQHKAKYGFDTQVIVGSTLGSNSSALTRTLLRDTPDVPKAQTSGPHNPTIVLVDVGQARDGRYYPAKAFVLSHDLYSATRLFRSSPVITDQLIDSTLLVVEDNNHDGLTELDSLSPNIRAIIELYESHVDMAESL
ncbi:MAG: hypothetical protein ACI9MC_001104 [Kiritimatiellia bacterium]|jgi:hypothetical protein